MRVSVTGDSNEESGVSAVIYDLAGPIDNHFWSKDYGSGLVGVGVVLMCRDPHLNFKRRVRFDRKDRWVDLDIMLDLEEMKQLGHETRKAVIVARIVEEVPAVLRKYGIPEFDEPRFSDDLKLWLIQSGASRIQQGNKH